MTYFGIYDTYIFMHTHSKPYFSLPAVFTGEIKFILWYYFSTVC